MHKTMWVMGTMKILEPFNMLMKHHIQQYSDELEGVGMAHKIK